MPSSRQEIERPVRADARRNRERVLAAAARAFAGEDPSATIEAIAREAGVGVGTIYRHFPTREALIEAAYRSELAAVCDAVPLLLAESSPTVALREWMDRFVTYMTTKLGMGDALRAVIASGNDPYAKSREMLDNALEQLLAAGSANGSLRADIPADDVLINLSGIAIAAGQESQREQAGRLLDLLMDALRYRPATKAAS
ncbi:TetR/AcrR family transcriptional regulator [Micromonospora trifolii]|uniref:TetR/AcrR family transcriptional regulator n=1 Tax=Micromonospora trifolii TaxID=2911208 RepID=UPI003CF24E17